MARTASSWKTTVTGIIQALGVLALTYGVMNEQEVAAWTGVSAAVLGAVLSGFYSRDDNVSSEGRKANKVLLLFLVAAPAVMLAPGCTSGSSAAQYRVAETLYVGAVTTATGAFETGAMSPDQAREFEAVRAEARATLDLWGELEVQGVGGEFDGWERLETLLDTMIDMQMEVRDGRSGNIGLDPSRDAGDRDGNESGRGGKSRWAVDAARIGPDPCRGGASGYSLADAA